MRHLNVTVQQIVGEELETELQMKVQNHNALLLCFVLILGTADTVMLTERGQLQEGF